MTRKTLTRRLRESGIATPESDHVTQVLAKEKSRRKAHKHRWFTPEGSSIQYCKSTHCMAHREVTS